MFRWTTVFLCHMLFSFPFRYQPSAGSLVGDEEQYTWAATHASVWDTKNDDTDVSKCPQGFFYSLESRTCLATGPMIQRRLKTNSCNNEEYPSDPQGCDSGFSKNLDVTQGCVPGTIFSLPQRKCVPGFPPNAAAGAKQACAPGSVFSLWDGTCVPESSPREAAARKILQILSLYSSMFPGQNTDNVGGIDGLKCPMGSVYSLQLKMCIFSSTKWGAPKSTFCRPGTVFSLESRDCQEAPQNFDRQESSEHHYPRPDDNPNKKETACPPDQFYCLESRTCISLNNNCGKKPTSCNPGTVYSLEDGGCRSNSGGRGFDYRPPSEQWGNGGDDGQQGSTPEVRVRKCLQGQVYSLEMRKCEEYRPCPGARKGKPTTCSPSETFVLGTSTCMGIPWDWSYGVHGTGQGSRNRGEGEGPGSWDVPPQTTGRPRKTRVFCPPGTLLDLQKGNCINTRQQTHHGVKQSCNPGTVYNLERRTCVPLSVTFSGHWAACPSSYDFMEAGSGQMPETPITSTNTTSSTTASTTTGSTTTGSTTTASTTTTSTTTTQRPPTMNPTKPAATTATIPYATTTSKGATTPTSETSITKNASSTSTNSPSTSRRTTKAPGTSTQPTTTGKGSTKRAMTTISKTTKSKATVNPKTTPRLTTTTRKLTTTKPTTTVSKTVRTKPTSTLKPKTITTAKAPTTLPPLIPFIFRSNENVSYDVITKNGTLKSQAEASFEAQLRKKLNIPAGTKIQVRIKKGSIIFEVIVDNAEGLQSLANLVQSGNLTLLGLKNESIAIPAQSYTESGKDQNVPIIIGSVIGAIALLAIGFSCGAIVFKNHKRKKQQKNIVAPAQAYTKHQMLSNYAHQRLAPRYGAFYMEGSMNDEAPGFPSHLSPRPGVVPFRAHLGTEEELYVTRRIENTTNQFALPPILASGQGAPPAARFTSPHHVPERESEI